MMLLKSIFNPQFNIFITPVTVFEMSTVLFLKVRCFICRVCLCNITSSLMEDNPTFTYGSKRYEYLLNIDFFYFPDILCLSVLPALPDSQVDSLTSFYGSFHLSIFLDKDESYVSGRW